MSHKILSVVGARPQFIKAAPVSRALKAAGLQEVMLHTGQHYDPGMSDIFFEQLEMPAPLYDLEIHGGTHGQMTARMIIGIEGVLKKENPDAVLIYGDTNSTLAGALVASKMNTPLVHVESGLRSYNKAMPEEINRITADHLSNLLFCPSLKAVENLEKEGITRNAFHVGDVMFDACLQAAGKSDIPLPSSPYALMTLHRQSTTQNAQALMKALSYADHIAKIQNLTLIFSVHPRTASMLKDIDTSGLKIELREPLGYFEMQTLLSKASLVLTDSGGLQKEAYFYKVPCITLRDETEWTETIDAGWNRLWTQSDWQQPRRDITEYGSGNASELIAQHIATFLS